MIIVKLDDVLCLSVTQPNPLGSRKFNDGDDGLKQGNRSYVLVWATKMNGRNGLSSGSLQITYQFDSSDIG